MKSVARTESVLIVDDQQPMRLLLSGILRGLEFQNVRQVASGRRALEVVRVERPDIVFLDLMMPDMHGLDVLSELRALDHGDQIFVIIQTGSATKENVERAVELGVGAILVKPYKVVQIKKVLGKYLKPSQSP